MATSAKENVLRWKKRLERNPDESTILSVIHKLSKVSITVELLQETGIGKVIRTLAKKSGLIGEKASKVLNHWRQVVACSQKSHENTSKNSKESIKKENDIKRSNSNKTSNKLTENLKCNIKPLILKLSPSKNKYELDNCESEVPDFKSLKYDEEDCCNDYDSGISSISPYVYKKAEASKYIDYDPHNDVNVGYNPDHPELYPDSSKLSKKNEKLQRIVIHINSKKCEIPSKKRKTGDDYVPENNKHLHKAKKFKTEVYQPTAISSNSHGENKRDLSKHATEKSKIHNHKREKEKKTDNRSSSVKTEKSVQLQDKSKKISAELKNVKESDGNHVLKKSKGKLKIKTTEEFTSSDVSFEDCLGLNDIVVLKKKKSSFKPSTLAEKEVISTHKKEKNIKKSSNVPVKCSELSGKQKVSKKSFEEHPDDIPKTLKMKRIRAKQNEVDIVSTLPQPQTNYRPLPQRSLDAIAGKKKVLSNEEAIKFTSSRREKTAVYSGRKNCFYTEVPTLFDCCTRVLIENIDFIEYMGEVPYFLVKQVLERCNPMQLQQIEDYNPYLLDDTHELWELHCKRDYRTYAPEENETWRDLYWRAYDEREKRLKSVTANISASMSKSGPARQVKLAYVDSVVKPPRDVARRQARHGTAHSVNHTIKTGASSKVVPKSSPSTANTTTTTAAAAASGSSHNTNAVPKKPKMAPLMAKTLKSMKMVYRR